MQHIIVIKTSLSGFDVTMWLPGFHSEILGMEGVWHFHIRSPPLNITTIVFLGEVLHGVFLNINFT